MLCPAKCSCFLCRELHSCRAADARKPGTTTMTDNFILKKADAWESSGAMKFIRGAARLSVRHWQNREPTAQSKSRLATHKSTSCEQLYPNAKEETPFGMRRVPSSDRVKPENKSVFKLLGNAKKKTNYNDEPKNKKSVLNFRKNEANKQKNVHEKYIPLSHVSNGSEHIYSEARPWNAQYDDCCKPPIYQSVDKNKGDVSRRSDESKTTNDKTIYSGRPPCYEELAERLAKKGDSPAVANKITQNNNKVVIYFGDSIIRKHNERKSEDVARAAPDVEEVIYANRLLDETANLGLSREVDKGGTQLVSEVEVQEGIYCEIKCDDGRESVQAINDATYKKEAIGTLRSDGFLVVGFEENYERARQLVEMVHSGAAGVDHHEATVLDEDDQFDWSFIQGWRKRPSTGCRPGEDTWCGGTPGLTAARATRVRIPAHAPTPAQPAAPAHARKLDPPPHVHHATPAAAKQSRPSNQELVCSPAASPGGGGAQLKCVSAPSQLTVQSTPVRATPAQSSYGLERKPKDADNAGPQVQNGVPECGSSSDENRSSGHASMSDSGGAGDAPREEPKRSKQPPHHARNKHRPHNKLQSPWPGGGGLEDIRSAIKQLTLRSRDSSSTATSGASSGGGANTVGGGSGAEARRRRAPLVRQPSLDTVCTNVTSADEFVWVDSHNRLVELRFVPWTAAEVARALSNGRCRDIGARLAPDTPPRLAYLLQRALVRVGREAQRLANNFGFCSRHEVVGAFRIVLSTPLADACVKGSQRAATMYATSGSAARRLGSAARARTSFTPGNFQRWMLDVRVAPFVHEYAAIYLCAGMETLLEEIALVVGATSAGGGVITPAVVEHALANSADLWGLLQPYSHLNAGRLSNGALLVSRWESATSLSSCSSSGAPTRAQQTQLGLSHDSGITTNGSGGSSVGSAQSVLLTTCAGSMDELHAVLRRAETRLPPLTAAAERALFYYMRCSQLESSCESVGAGGVGNGLWSWRGARAGVPLPPPLGEWCRVLKAFTSLRPPPATPDADDVLQAARLLLPHNDCPPRSLTMEESVEARWSRSSETMERLSIGLAHRVLLSGRSDLLQAMRNTMPAGIDSLDQSGLTALMKAAALGDEQIIAMLLEAGADPNIETPGASPAHSSLLVPRANADNAPQANVYTPPTAGWTALVYACAAAGNSAVECAKRLLTAGAKVEGAVSRSEICTLTPLQVACGGGNLELVQLLLSHGADPFLSTQQHDSLCYSAAAQYGCYSAISVCCTHGRGSCLRAVLCAQRGGGAEPAMWLEEVLAEGNSTTHAPHTPQSPHAFTRRALQDALYHAAETDRLDITMELRSLGVPWSLHAWTLSLAAAAEASLDHVIDQLLQDFLQVCPSDDSHYSNQFIHECLPLLFNIFRYSKKEGTVLLLADILCCVYGWEPVGAVSEPAPATVATATPRIDPSYVNNPCLADVTFRVEGRLFYGHKIVLVSESARLRSMLAPPKATNNDTTTPPLVQINDIRYHIFEQVMKYLYSGGCSGLEIPESDVLEVLAAASFFQLLPLQRHCEARAARSVDLHNLVSVYIHAKVYGAVQLLEYCQGFLLQNMVALLTYDDSVKRLLFGKRLPGHNVLAALLHTLQKRVEMRKTQTKGR